MKNNYYKVVSLIILLITVMTVGTVSVIKTNNIHKKQLFKSIESKIEEKALMCSNKNECEGNEIKLQELYEKNYLETQINPLNNEFINPDSYVVIINPKEAELKIVE